MAIVESTSRWGVFLDEALDKAWTARGEKVDPCYTKFLKEETIDGSSLIQYRYAGLGKHTKTPELNPISYDNYEQGAKRTTTPDKYALGFRISRELLDDIANGDRVKERLKAFKDITEQLRDSAEQTMEELAAQVILQADSATATANWVGAGSDGKALAATDHVTLKNPVATNSNKQTGASLSPLQLQSAITTMETMQSDEGYFQKLSKSAIVVAGPYWRHRLYEIVNTKQQIDSNNNNVSPLNDFDIKVLINPHIGASNKQFAVISKDDLYKVYYVMRQRPTFEQENDFEVKGRKYSSHFRFKVDFADYRRFVWNAGS